MTTDWTHYLDLVLFVVLPYLSVVLLIVVTIQRYRTQKFTYSSLSSQFLENKQHFWSLVPFHYGILVVLGGHFVAFLIPRGILWWNQIPLRTFVLEVSALIFALLALLGLMAGIVRRFSSPRLMVVTSVADWILYALLLGLIVSGIAVAVFYPWGSTWFAASVTPYLNSLVLLNPDIEYIKAMPHLVKWHMVNAWALIAFFPFTRLVHILVIPNPYLWRRPQVVRWYGRGPRGEKV